MKRTIMGVYPIESMVGKELAIDQHPRKDGSTSYEISTDKVVEIKWSVPKEDDEQTKIEPGIYNIARVGHGMGLEKRNVLLEPNVEGMDSLHIDERIQRFFERSEFYTKRKLFPKRGVLVHGPPGCGKTHNLNKTVLNQIGQNGVALFVSMDQFEAGDITRFIERNPVADSVNRLFIVIEDLGGGEQSDERPGSFASSSSLLSLLDGNALPRQDLPTVILSTTNYPKNFLANILDRPGRFDEVVEMKLPAGEALVAFAERMEVGVDDFSKRELLKGGLSLAHVKEACVRFAVYDESIHKTIVAMRAHSEKTKKDETMKNT